jgi:arsenate reductase
MVTFIEYPKCGTCRKARKWLAENDIEYESRHIVEDTPSKSELKSLYERSELPLKRFFNTSGNSYRKGNFKDRLPEMSEDEALDELAADGMLIKRPILVTDDGILVGFKEDKYADLLLD